MLFRSELETFRKKPTTLRDYCTKLHDINVLELFIRPLSLCMRLFGNVLGAVVVMALIKYLLPLVVPLPFSGYFDIFDGVIQAYVFVFLTSLYIKEAIE